jgi:hypothetical protein
MAEIKRYICTASTGGDGTTTNLTGATAAYATLEACMAASEQDLTDSGGDTFVAEIFGDCSTDDTTKCLVDGAWVTSSTCTITIKTVGDARHAGIYNNSKYLNTGTEDQLYIQENYVTVDGLQFFADWNRYRSIRIGASNVTVKNCIFKSAGPSCITTSSSSYIFNCIMFGTETTYSNGVYQAWNSSGTVYIYSCTAYNLKNGYIDELGSSVQIKNSIAVSCTACYSGTFKNTSTHNIASDTTTPEFGTYYDSKTITFVDAANGDFHLASTESDAINMGTDTSGESAPLNFNTDIDGTTRSGTWDIGADEYVDAGTTVNVSPVTGLISLISSTRQISSNKSVSVISGILTVISPTITTGTSATVNVNNIKANLTVISPSTTSSATVNVSVIRLIGLVATPSITAGGNATFTSSCIRCISSIISPIKEVRKTANNINSNALLGGVTLRLAKDLSPIQLIGAVIPFNNISGSEKIVYVSPILAIIEIKSSTFSSTTPFYPVTFAKNNLVNRISKIRNSFSITKGGLT